MTADMPYFYGSAENKLNSKGQVAIPARFRSLVSEDEKGGGYAITRGEGQCLYMYTHRQFARIKNNVKIVAEEKNDSDFYRTFMAEVVAVEIDTQGRFVLPQPFMKAVGITGPAILFIGMDDRIEIWDPEVYSRSKQKVSSYEEQRQSNARRIFGL